MTVFVATLFYKTRHRHPAQDVNFVKVIGMSDTTLNSPSAVLVDDLRKPRDTAAVAAPAQLHIAGNPLKETARQRLRRLESQLTDDSQGWMERQDAQGEVDFQNLTRLGLLMAALSTAFMFWLFLG